MAAVALWYLWKNKPQPRALMLSLFAVFLFAAFFLAWRDQYLRAPKLSGSIERAIKVSDPVATYTEIFMLVTLRNSGGATGVENWNLRIKSSELNVTIPTVEIAPVHKVSNAANGFPEMVFHGGENAFYQKALRPQVGILRGWLRFRLDGIRADRIPESAEYEISFTDEAGNITRCKRPDKNALFAQDLGLFFSFPGVENPFPIDTNKLGRRSP